MRRRSAFTLTAAILATAPGHAAEPAGNMLLESLNVGVLLHDRGPTSDRHEHGVDPNVEVQFVAPDRDFWRAIGAPRTHVGITPNFSGETSVVYAGITYAFDIRPRLFAELALGFALHNGPLHADDRRACERESDCGFGSRVIPRYGLELGIRLDDGHAVSLFYDHMSHYETLADENEGIDHTGLRYRFRY